MINKIFLLGRLACEPVVESLDTATASIATVPDRDPTGLEVVLSLTTFAPRLTAEGDLGHDLQTVDVHVRGRVADLARLVLEPGQLLWVEGRLESVSADLDAANDNPGSGSAARLRIVSTWFTILASAEASGHLEAFATVGSKPRSGQSRFAPEPLVSTPFGGAR